MGKAGVFAQHRVPEGTNEAKAVLELLEHLILKGRIVTADAAFCSPDICEAVVHQDSHYVLAVKDNQSALKQAISSEFAVLDAARFSTNTGPRPSGVSGRRNASASRPSTRDTGASNDARWRAPRHSIRSCPNLAGPACDRSTASHARARRESPRRRRTRRRPRWLTASPTCPMHRPMPRVCCRSIAATGESRTARSTSATKPLAKTAVVCEKEPPANPGRHPQRGAQPAATRQSQQYHRHPAHLRQEQSTRSHQTRHPQTMIRPGLSPGQSPFSK